MVVACPPLGGSGVRKCGCRPRSGSRRGLSRRRWRGGLRVSWNSAYVWRRRWRVGGEAALASRGPGGAGRGCPAGRGPAQFAGAACTSSAFRHGIAIDERSGPGLRGLPQQDTHTYPAGRTKGSDGAPGSRARGPRRHLLPPAPAEPAAAGGAGPATPLLLACSGRT